MPSIPIPISSPTNTGPVTPPRPSGLGVMPSKTTSTTSPSSSMSISPQTPFFPPPGTIQPNNHNVMPSSPPKGGQAMSPTSNGFFKWAAAAASLGKSLPTDMTSPTQQRGFTPDTTSDLDDPLEFGDIDDLKSRSWNAKRAASMSCAPGHPSGITSMLSGFGATSPTVGQNKDFNPPAAGGMSVPTSGVLADNAARGQGVLRRLSMSGGTGFVRPSFLSPGYAPPPLPSPPGNTPKSSPPLRSGNTAPQPIPEPPKADASVQRAATVSGTGSRGRRYSEAGTRKRGVSPMGERLLRDHGHF